jgi:hypothetical protein
VCRKYLNPGAAFGFPPMRKLQLTRRFLSIHFWPKMITVKNTHTVPLISLRITLDSFQKQRFLKRLKFQDIENILENVTSTMKAIP